MMLSKVRGTFRTFEGTIVTGKKPDESTVTATIDLNSIDTGETKRDAHIRSADFFEVETYPTMTYKSVGLREDGDEIILRGSCELPSHPRIGLGECRASILPVQT